MKAVIWISFSILISGCYCSKLIVKPRSGSHPRWLYNISYDSSYVLCFDGGGRFLQLNPYYGSFSPDIDKIEKSIKTGDCSFYEIKLRKRDLIIDSAMAFSISRSTILD